MKVVTYNIQYSKGSDGRFDLPRVVEAVRGADIIALQEVERFWPRSGMVDQPAEIAGMLEGYDWVYGPAFDMSVGPDADGTQVPGRRRQFGTMLLSRWPILFSRLHVLPKAGTVDVFNMDLGALVGVVDIPFGPLRVYSLHLSGVSASERCRQLKTLLDIHRQALFAGGAWTGDPDALTEEWRLGDPPPSPQEAVILGDCNFAPDSIEYDLMVGPRDRFKGRAGVLGGFKDAWTTAGHVEDDGYTWATPDDSDRVRIDHCFVSAPLAQRVKSAWIDNLAQGSDHYPLWVELDL